MMTVSILWSKFSEKQEYIFNLCKKAYLEENTDAEILVVKKKYVPEKIQLILVGNFQETSSTRFRPHNYSKVIVTKVNSEYANFVLENKL